MNCRIAVFILAALVELSGAADWPQWRGPNRDGTTVGVKVPAKWPGTLKQIWEKKIGKGYSSPVMAGGRIFVHSRQDEDEVVSCLDPADGRAIWSGRYPAPWQVKPGAGDDKGPHSTPTVSGGRVFTLGVNGVLTCWDTRNGDVKWRWEPPDGPKGVIPMYGAALSPVVADGLVYAHGSGEPQTAIAAFDAATGQMKWAWHGDEPAYATPVLTELAGRRQLVLLSESKLAGLSPADGKVLWTKSMRRRNSYENIITPVIYKDLVIYAETGYPEIMAVRIVRRGDTMNVEDVWTNKDHRLQECTPIVSGDLLIGLAHPRVGHLFCLNAATGANLWEHGSGLQSEVPLINAGSVVLAVTKGIRVNIFRPNAERYDPAVELQGPVQGLSAGTVFMGDRILWWDSGALRMMSFGE